MSTTFKFQISHVPRTLAPSRCLYQQQIRRPYKQDWRDNNYLNHANYILRVVLALNLVFVVKFEGPYLKRAEPELPYHADAGNATKIAGASICRMRR